MLRSFLLLLCLGFAFCSTQQNYTVDDTSPDIHYSGPTFPCNTTTCPFEATGGLSNNSITLTNETITFLFTGTAVYASIELIGTCFITVDGDEIANLSVTLADAINGGELQNVSKSNMANGPHSLIIDPTTRGTVIGLDHLIYTAASGPPAKSHVGAIVGGVIGGVALTIGVLFVALWARRHRLIMRRNQRKNVILRGITSARPNPDYKAGVDDGKDLST
ncbi:hypothetical protein MSAN_00867200 [Mycena sanguinolenta]|uniref:Uncharacterized protein n=1 Tax=Mycena sanguinolenta TaxID=230812 RepID=A0A8H6Z098_9AGAR|nr:hypothetical protein MSAN_00867200 [Mycena sanguinolenta]